MLLFCLITTAYVWVLILYIPSPESLKGPTLSLIDNFKQIRASIFSGVILLFIFLVITNFSFIKVDEHLYATLGLVNAKDAKFLSPLQVVSHLFIHANLIHVLSNVAGIGIASVYERRVGPKRFVIVLMVGAFSSVPSILFYSEPSIASGISGGVFALGAAYFTDHENLTTKEWIYAILGVLFLAAVLSFDGEKKSPSMQETAFLVDHLGHFLGAAGGILYCRWRPIQSHQSQLF